jgi:hypothetical protein
MQLYTWENLFFVIPFLFFLLFVVVVILFAALCRGLIFISFLFLLLTLFFPTFPLPLFFLPFILLLVFLFFFIVIVVTGVDSLLLLPDQAFDNSPQNQLLDLRREI